MEKQELIEKINAALAEEFEIDVEDITPDGDIKGTLELDSLSLVDMVALVESESGVKIKGSDVAQIKTFGALYDYLVEHQN
ncbi:MAG: phosphopantetheine-binding protein [Bacteroidales bacterium]|nr:phosphopantetheine-binding protein [Bacteroides sp.]MCM1198643.1 phosphopantetheine-binding protein [Clostridium sp.]MCM1501272.1 phosphopantetheine-binding protein [Bacteroidales bacterium]